MALFEHRPRSDQSPKFYLETEYEFLDRAAGPYWNEVRALLNAWYDRIPLRAQADMAGSLRSGVASQFQSAFWELYLHELFHRQGFDVCYQPELPRPGKPPLTPDFLLERDGRRLYVEATVMNSSNALQAMDAAQVALQDEINRRIRATGFIVTMQVLKQGRANDVAPSRVANNVCRWIDTLNAEDTSVLQRAYPTASLETFLWEGNGWKLEFTASALQFGEESLDRPVGMRIVEPGVVLATKDPHDLRDQLKTKAKKYADAKEPIIIAAMIERRFLRDTDIPSALFGNLGAEAALQGQGLLDPTWPSDIGGLWATKQGARYQNVPAVITSRHLEPALVAEVQPTVWLNPWSDHDVSEMFLWQSYQASPCGERLEWHGARSAPSEILGLPHPWPQSEEPGRERR